MSPCSRGCSIRHLADCSPIRVTSLFHSWEGITDSCVNSNLLAFSKYFILVVVLQLPSYVQLFATPGTTALQASLSFTISRSLRKFMSIELMMPSNHLILCRSPLLLPSIFPSIRVFSNELFTSGGQSIGASASVLLTNIQSWLPLGLTGCISLLSKGLSSVFSSTTVWKHQFFNAQPFLWSNSYIHTWLLEKPYLWLYGPLWAKWHLCFLIWCRDSS